jgi:hypothetical protein
LDTESSVLGNAAESAGLGVGIVNDMIDYPLENIVLTISASHHGINDQLEYFVELP